MARGGEVGSVRHLVTVVLAAWFLLTCSGQPDDITTAAEWPLDRGVQQFFRGDYAAAIESLEMSIDQHGADGASADRSAERQAHQYLARCYLALGKFTDAGRSVKQAIDIGPDDAELYNI